jgi:hypothetical protein
VAEWTTDLIPAAPSRELRGPDCKPLASCWDTGSGSVTAPFTRPGPTGTACFEMTSLRQQFRPRQLITSACGHETPTQSQMPPIGSPRCCAAANKPVTGANATLLQCSTLDEHALN